MTLTMALALQRPDPKLQTSWFRVPDSTPPAVRGGPASQGGTTAPRLVICARLGTTPFPAIKKGKRNPDKKHIGWIRLSGNSDFSKTTALCLVLARQTRYIADLNPLWHEAREAPRHQLIKSIS